MFRLLKDLYYQGRFLTSDLFNERTFYASFCRDLKRAKKSIVIESPYLTERWATYYASLFKALSKRRVKIRINTRHPRYHDERMKA